MITSKKHLALLFVLGAAVTSLVMADSIDDFVSALNQAWSQTNDVQALQVINDRLSADTNDVLGLSCKMYFYVFAQGNLTNARLTADSFIGVFGGNTNSDLVAYAQAMREEVYSIPLDESGPYSTQQQAQLRQPISSFPFIEKSVVVARWFEQ